MWPCHPSLSAVPCLSSVPPCPIPSPLPWATSLGQSIPLSQRMTLPPMSPRPHQLACDMPASRAHRPPATVNGTAHCGAPGAQSWTATWAARAPASSARWTAATQTTALTLPACWLWLQRPWVEPPCQVSREGTSFDYWLMLTPIKTIKKDCLVDRGTCLLCLLHPSTRCRPPSMNDPTCRQSNGIQEICRTEPWSSWHKLVLSVLIISIFSNSKSL